MKPPTYPYNCANLSVPLDYTDDNSEALTLNLIQVEALNKPAKGSILFNPGGPGSPGTEYVAVYADVLHEVLGGDYNLIGFDPRGTGKTIPFNCNLTGMPLTLETRDVPGVTAQLSLEDALEEYWPDNQVTAERCYEEMNATGSLIGTAFVARDMLKIVDALDEDGLLNYWGTSYGTYLGATFAAMFPDSVGRVLLDSNVNLHHFRSGDYLDRNLDTDKAFLAFLDECVARPDECGLARWAPSGEAPELLEFYNSLMPLMNENNSTAPWSWSLLKQATYQLLYAPAAWTTLISLQLDLFINVTLGIEPPEPEDDSDSDSDDSDLPSDPDDVLRVYNLGIDANDGIACGDSTWRASTVDDLRPLARQQWDSSSFAEVFPTSSWTCAVWKMFAKEVYDGDFAVTTKNPIMLVNGVYDPVTPYASAVNTSAGFEGSVLLKHLGFGHGVNAHPSLCTGRAIREFFVDGTLPDEGTECTPDLAPFDLPDPLGGLLPEVGMERRSLEGLMTEEDVRMYEAMREMGKRDAQMRRWRGEGFVSV